MLREAKRSQAKPSETKRRQAKRRQAKRSQAKRSRAKPSEAKRSQAKRSQGKPNQAKPSQAKRSQAKPPEAKRSLAKPIQTNQAKPSDAELSRFRLEVHGGGGLELSRPAEKLSLSFSPGAISWWLSGLACFRNGEWYDVAYLRRSVAPLQSLWFWSLFGEDLLEPALPADEEGRSLRLPKGRHTPEVFPDQIYSRMVYSKLSSVLCTPAYRAVCATVVCFPPPHSSSQGGRGDGRG